MSPLKQFYGPARQRGAIGLMAAVTFGLALLLMLLVVDSGRLYMEQRKLQRVAATPRWRPSAVAAPARPA